MNFGAIQGNIAGTESVVFDYKVSGSAVSSITTGNILNGDADGLYTVIVRVIGNSIGSWVGIQFNGDTGTNYGMRQIRSYNTSTANENSASSSAWTQYVDGTNTSFCMCRIYAKSGAARLLNATRIYQTSATTVTEMSVAGLVWSNTADNIVSMTLNSVAGGNVFGVGTRITILRDNNFTNGTPTGVINTSYIAKSWVRVGSSVLGSAATSVTFSGLAGDRDIVYALSAAVKNGYNGSCQSTLTFNSDTTQSHYGFQRLYVTNTTVASDRYTNASTEITNISTLNYYGMSTALIFAESGYIRPYLVCAMRSITTTTVTLLLKTGATWNDTGAVVTQLVLTSDQANGFGTGSQFELYALRPNG